jgi:hypothetical protein
MTARNRSIICGIALSLATAPLLGFAKWPRPLESSHLSSVGSGVAVIFSPDLALPGNREVYERLGFAYFEDSDWFQLLGELRERSRDPRFSAIEAVILETHGTNGHGLKLQDGEEVMQDRSYISVGALQEALDEMGVRRCFLSACNAGRLLRPEIYCALDLKADDPLFMTPTYEVLNASPGFDPASSSVQILRRKQSNLETLVHASSSEFSDEVRKLLGVDKRLRFNISTMLIQLVMHDPKMQLTATGFVQEKSDADLTRAQSERLFERFLKFLSEVAARENRTASELRARR